MKRARPPDDQPTLYQHAQAESAPLADRMRPASFEELLGQERLLASDGALARAIAEDRIPSLILWGPPGSGKTSLARLLSRGTRSVWVPFSAVTSGLPELRVVIAEAKQRRNQEGRGTLLFVDEIHRFNRSQQDAFLPHLEAGTVTLIGATTENPSFSINAAVLSRCRVLHLSALESEQLVNLLERALMDPNRGLGKRGLRAAPEVLKAIAETADGDARRALGLLESAAALVTASETDLSAKHLELAADERTLLFDKHGDQHYDVVSALIKSLRGSDPDAAIYWMMRLLEAGDDPLFVLRRLIIFASEDIGNADPRALGIAVDADAAFRRLGMPEGMYPIAQACLYLACAPKSNRATLAWHSAQTAVRQHGSLPVPRKLRNAPTALMKQEGHGEGYKYPHDFPGHYVAGETYLPEKLVGKHFYDPSDQGVERQIHERLQKLRSLRRTDE